MLWHEQPWPRIQSLDKELPVVVPLGSVEQHGRHLPLVVDTAQVTAIAERAEKALGDAALFLPTLWLGCSDHHMDFPGTVSVPPDVYALMIRRVAKSILNAGFWRILFVNGHGGNETPGAQALTQLVAEDDVADGACLAFSSWWQLGRDACAPQRHDMTTPGISHACEYETSLMLALRPELVAMNNVREAPPVHGGTWYDSGKVKLFRRFHRITAAGNLGKPGAATAEKGRSMLDAITADVVSFVREFSTWPRLKPLGPRTAAKSE
jgi:creatinine amidohydrolase